MRPHTRATGESISLINAAWEIHPMMKVELSESIFLSLAFVPPDR